MTACTQIELRSGKQKNGQHCMHEKHSEHNTMHECDHSEHKDLL